MSSKIARDIFSHALASVLPQNFMKNTCSLEDDIFFINGVSYDVSEYKNIYVFGSGKAAYSMAKEIEDILGDRIYKGLVIALDDGEALEVIEVKCGAHPIPTDASIEATKALVAMMQECDEDDLYIYLLSGGSSALLELPTSPITLEELQKATDLMLSNTLEIQDINCVRKHISSIKGGRLAQKCKATGVVLVLSDVIGDDLYAIGSAPLYADDTSFAQAKKILEEKNIYLQMPQSIQNVLSAALEETPFKPLARVSHHIIASNKHAKEAAKEYALSLGLDVKVFEESFHGEVSNAVENIFQTIKDSKENCFIFGGEATVDVHGNGEGGRNQHATLLALKRMKEQDINITFLSAATDGIDGNSPATGGVVDASLLEKIDRQTIQEYLDNCDSYNFLKILDALVIIGATGTNVIDLIIIIKGDTDV